MSTLAPERKLLTTASQAPLICNGTARELYDHWLIRTDQAQPPDLSDNFEVQWGKRNETFVLDWIERTQRAAINERQRFLIHPTLRWCGCTLDGYRADDDAVIECKILDPYLRSHEFQAYYAPQLVVQRACRGAKDAILVVQQGNHAPKTYPVPIDEAYEAQVFTRLAAFQQCVDNRVPPGPPPASLVPPAQWRSYDTAERPLPNWLHAMMPTLEEWQTTKAVADAHQQTKVTVKELLPPDVGRVVHGRIVVKRNRNGAVTVAEET